MNKDISNTLTLIQEKEKVGESNYDHTELLIQLKEQVEKHYTQSSAPTLSESNSSTETTQFIVMKVGIQFSRDEDETPLPDQRTEDVERKLFDAIEHMRQEGNISPEGLSANWITVDVERVDPANNQ